MVILRVVLCALCAALSLGPRAVQAQVRPTQATQDSLRRLAESRLGAAGSNQEILERLRQSGLSRGEMRTRLQQMGYDPSLADPYFDRLARGDSMPGRPDDTFARALRDIGLMAGRDSAQDRRGEDPAAPRRVGGERSRDRPRGGDEIFGRDLFTRESNEFTPSVTGPVDPSYQLGPGDELTLVLTGDVERVHAPVVNREGYIVIPDVGQIAVAGLTLAQLEDLLYERLGRMFSGVRRGAGATTRFHVSIGRLRTIRVTVTGDVEWPGAYDLTSAATVFHALYQAGGPSLIGSFRRIQVRRGGNVVRTVDLYDYLLRGDNSNDVRLQHGDIVFVPSAQLHVQIEGAVRRPAKYELLPQDDARDLLAFAAGVEPGAILRHVQIDRILRPGQRTPGVDRTLVDVDLENITGDGRAPALQDGDIVHVFAVSDERRNRITLTGSVRQPGLFEWRHGLTLQQVIERAGGLEEHALRGRAHIYRLNPENGTRQLIPVSLDDGRASATLVDRDSIIIYDRAALTPADSITIDGQVNKPGRYPLAAGMTLQDVVLAARGFRPGAYVLSLEVARVVSSVTRGDSLATVFLLPLTSDTAANGNSHAVDQLNWTPAANEFELRRGDHVNVRRMPGYEELQPVRVAGEVQFPGTFVLRSRQERIASVLRRAGGITSEGYPEGIQVWRKGSLLGIDVKRALDNPSSRYNVPLEEGDSIHVPRYDPTVLVQGAVGFVTRVLYAPGQGPDYYINQAGGYADDADSKRLSVVYPNGERQTRRSTLMVQRDPDVRPGSSIYVPRRAEPREGFNWDRALSQTLTVMTSLATLLIAYQQLK